MAEAGAAGNDDHLIGLSVDGEGAVPLRAAEGRIRQEIGGDHVVIDLIVIQPAPGLLEGHGLRIAPFRLAVIQDGGGNAVPPAGGQGRGTVHVGHDPAEMPVLGIVAVGVEMGRAVRIREFQPRKGVGHKVVDAPDEEMVRQIFFQPEAFLPAVVAENLAHGAPGLPGLQCGSALAQLAEAVMEEDAVPREVRGGQGGLILALGIHLAADIVDARHILAGQAPEVMAEAGAGPAVMAVVLNDVADVHDAVLPAPGSELLGEVLLHQPGQAVHVQRVNPGGFGPGILVPQPLQVPGPAVPHHLRQLLLQLLSPGKVLAGAQQVALVIQETVAQLRLVGEETGDGFAEIRRVVLPVGLVNRVNQHADAVCLGHVDVVPVEAGIPADHQHPELGLALRLVKGQNLPVQPVRQIRFGLSLPQENPEHPVVVKDAGRRLVEESGFHRVGGNPCRRLQHLPLPQVDADGAAFGGQGKGIQKNALPAEAVRFSLQGAVGEARREVAVVQDPDLHVPLLGLVQDHVHILPPFGTAEIRMRPAFHADRPAVYPVNGGHHFPQGGFRFPVLPEEGQNMVVLPVFQQGLNGSVHDVSFLFCHSRMMRMHAGRKPGFSASILTGTGNICPQASGQSLNLSG